MSQECRKFVVSFLYKHEHFKKTLHYFSGTYISWSYDVANGLHSAAAKEEMEAERA